MGTLWSVYRIKTEIRGNGNILDPYLSWSRAGTIGSRSRSVCSHRSGACVQTTQHPGSEGGNRTAELTQKWLETQGSWCYSRQLKCLFISLSMITTKKYQSTALVAFWERNPPLIGGFSLQRASNAENVSMLWLNHSSDSNDSDPLSEGSELSQNLNGSPTFLK